MIRRRILQAMAAVGLSVLVPGWACAKGVIPDGGELSEGYPPVLIGETVYQTLEYRGEPLWLRTSVTETSVRWNFRGSRVPTRGVCFDHTDDEKLNASKYQKLIRAAHQYIDWELQK